MSVMDRLPGSCEADLKFDNLNETNRLNRTAATSRFIIHGNYNLWSVDSAPCSPPAPNDAAGKTYIVTGAKVGLGFETGESMLSKLPLYV